MPLLALDHENALAGEDDEVLLLFAFSVVEAVARADILKACFR